MNKILKSILILIIGIVVVLLSFSFLIRIIPYFGKIFLLVGLGMVLFGFFSFLFTIFQKK
jgi:hypothetical protein